MTTIDGVLLDEALDGDLGPVRTRARELAEGQASRGASEAVLRVRDIWIHDGVGDRDVVRAVSFELMPGKVLGIVGESGSGKTLTCRAVLGILPEHFAVSRGSIELAGRDVSALTPGSGRRCAGRRSAPSSRTQLPISTPRSGSARRSRRSCGSRTG